MRPRYPDAGGNRCTDVGELIITARGPPPLHQRGVWFVGGSAGERKGVWGKQRPQECRGHAELVLT